MEPQQPLSDKAIIGTLYTELIRKDQSVGQLVTQLKALQQDIASKDKQLVALHKQLLALQEKHEPRIQSNPASEGTVNQPPSDGKA